MLDTSVDYSTSCPSPSSAPIGSVPLCWIRQSTTPPLALRLPLPLLGPSPCVEYVSRLLHLLPFAFLCPYWVRPLVFDKSVDYSTSCPSPSSALSPSSAPIGSVPLFLISQSTTPPLALRLPLPLLGPSPCVGYVSRLLHLFSVRRAMLPAHFHLRVQIFSRISLTPVASQSFCAASGAYQVVFTIRCSLLCCMVCNFFENYRARLRVSELNATVSSVHMLLQSVACSDCRFVI